MDKIASLGQTEREELFQETANNLGMVAAAVEKDFWVCWILNKIFSHQTLSQQLLFKGGTSLSKCFELIERFSEDIDLILDWNLLTDEDPYVERSNRQQDLFNKRVNAVGLSYVKETLYNNLTQVFDGVGQLDSGDENKKELIFHYPKSFESEYIKSEVLIEVSPVSAMAPNRDVVIQTYAAKQFPKLFEKTDIDVKTIEARKTFWDKVTILHGESHRPDDKPQPDRYSRHYYDVYQMLDTWVKQEAMDDIELLKSVAAFKKKFYPQGWANYQAIIDDNIQLVPAEPIRENLNTDYEGMQEMIYGNYPAFSDILNVLEQFQVEVNEAMRN